MSRYWRPPADYEPTPFQRILLNIIHDHWLTGAYDLARRIDVSGPTVVQWLRKDVVTHDAGILGRICLTFGVPYGDLYTAVGLDTQIRVPAMPASYVPTAAPTQGGDQWDDAFTRIRALPGLPPEIAEQVVGEMLRARMRAERQTRTQHYIDAEHTVQPYDGATLIEVPAITPPPAPPASATPVSPPTVPEERPQQHQRAVQARSHQADGDNDERRAVEVRERRGPATPRSRARVKRS